MVHVTCDQAGVHTPTEWLLQLPGAATHYHLVATYATVDHQALTPGIAARVSLKKITLVSWTRGRGLYFTCFVSLMARVYILVRASHFQRMDVGSSKQRPCRRQGLVLRQTGINGFYLKLLGDNKLWRKKHQSTASKMSFFQDNILLLSKLNIVCR